MMQIITFVLYVLALALASAVLLWAGDRILLALRARRGHRQRKSAASPAGDQTQYSMFSQAPIGDGTEYDPLAEAEIYLTYGNRQMALDTLIKAIREYPERDDISSRLAELRQSDNA
jgi:Tfp pilus assembly protein FimV